MRRHDDAAEAERARLRKICFDKLALADRALASQEGSPFTDSSYRAAVVMTQDVLRDILQQIEPTKPERESADIIRLFSEAATDSVAQHSDRSAESVDLYDLAEGAVFHFFCCGRGVHTEEDGCGELVPTMAALARAIGFRSDPATDAEIAAVPPLNRREGGDA